MVFPRFLRKDSEVIGPLVPEFSKKPMSIDQIVEQALKDGYLTPSMEAEVGRICDMSSELSIEEYMALDRLMGALLTGEVIAVPRKQFINVMEELVISRSIARVAEIEASSTQSLDVGDIAAYALNRLPPLYATTEEGANYQRQKAREELQGLINEQVDAALSRYLDRPDFFPERQAITSPNQDKSMLAQVSKLLEGYAPGFEQEENVFS
ncbi:Late competence development protein ComFB [Picosynechococcus sp. OG1]|nr:Late competence development protein ComFB [Picosynechococcus sp. OG1]SMQ82979.1 Late competence development protein ComFB [Synechococcus sp. 7002]